MLPQHATAVWSVVKDVLNMPGSSNSCWRSRIMWRICTMLTTTTTVVFPTHKTELVWADKKNCHQLLSFFIPWPSWDLTDTDRMNILRSWETIARLLLKLWSPGLYNWLFVHDFTSYCTEAWKLQASLCSSGRQGFLLFYSITSQSVMSHVNMMGAPGQTLTDLTMDQLMGIGKLFCNCSPYPALSNDSIFWLWNNTECVSDIISDFDLVIVK